MEKLDFFFLNFEKIIIKKKIFGLIIIKIIKPIFTSKTNQEHPFFFIMMSSQPKLTAKTYQMGQMNQSPPPSYNMNNPNMPLMQPQSFNPQPSYAQPRYQQPMSMMQPLGIIATTTVINSAPVFTAPTFRGNQNLYCPNCQSSTISNVQFIPGGGAFIVCLGLFMCVGVFALITFCCDDCKDAHHYCCRCGAHLGEVRFLLD